MKRTRTDIDRILAISYYIFVIFYFLSPIWITEFNLDYLGLKYYFSICLIIALSLIFLMLFRWRSMDYEKL